MHLRWLELKPPTIEGNFSYHTYINKYRLAVSFSFSRLPRIEIRGWGGRGEIAQYFWPYLAEYLPQNQRTENSHLKVFSAPYIFCLQAFYLDLHVQIFYIFTRILFPWFRKHAWERRHPGGGRGRGEGTWGLAACCEGAFVPKRHCLVLPESIFFSRSQLRHFLKRCFYPLFLFICIVLFKFSSSGWYTWCDEFYISSSFLFTICNVFCFFLPPPWLAHRCWPPKRQHEAAGLYFS